MVDLVSLGHVPWATFIYHLSLLSPSLNSVLLTDIPAQRAKIRQGLDTLRISSKCVSMELRSLRKFDRSVFTQLNSKVGKNAWALMAALKNSAKTVEL